MAIIYSYPLNDDIKPLDELVGTTEKNINGQLKTVTRNFLLQDLAEFLIVDGGLQKTIILTTTGDSGPSTLDQVTGILNIPQYAGLQDLQQVTDVGATTTNGITITVGDGGVNGITSFSSQGYGVRGESSETIGVYGTSTSGAGVYGFSGSEGVIGEGSTGVKGIGYYGVNGNSYDGVGVLAQTNIGIGVSATAESEGIAIYAYSTSGKGIEVNGNGTIAIEANLGNSNKGLVINSGTSSTGNPIVIDKNGVEKLVVNQQGDITANSFIKIGNTGTNVLLDDGNTIALSEIGGNQNLQEVTDEGAETTNSIKAASFVRDGGFDFQFLKADGSVDNNTYLTSADLPSTLDLYATTSPDPVISGYTALVRNITDTRYNTTAVNVPTPIITGTELAPTFCGAVISDPSILLGNPGVFNFSVIGKIRRTGGSTSSGADFFFSIYKRNLAGVETLIADSAPVVVPANGGTYVEYISTALWNDGIFLSTDRVVLKFYGIKTGGGSGATYEFLFGGSDPVRGTATISSAIIPNIYLRDLADVEKVDALNNEVLYWNDSASLWEHELVENLVPLATATQKGLVSIGTQTFAGDKTFTGTIALPSTTSIGNVSSTEISYLDGVTSGIQTSLDGKVSLATTQTITAAKTFSNNITVSANIIGTNTPDISNASYSIIIRNASTGVFEKLGATTIQPLIYNILIASTIGITTQTLGTNSGLEYSQDGRNVMIDNGTTPIQVTASNASSSFIASYTKLGTANITFATSGTLVAPYGATLNGNPGSTALLTKNGTTVYLLVNNLL